MKISLLYQSGDEAACIEVPDSIFGFKSGKNGTAMITNLESIKFPPFEYDAHMVITHIATPSFTAPLTIPLAHIKATDTLMFSPSSLTLSLEGPGILGTGLPELEAVEAGEAHLLPCKCGGTAYWEFFSPSVFDGSDAKDQTGGWLACDTCRASVHGDTFETAQKVWNSKNNLHDGG